MKLKLGFVFLLLALALASASCGSSNIGAQPFPNKDAAAFKLSVDDESLMLGASASGYNVSVEEYGRDVVVSVNVENAARLRALYFTLEYDAEAYRPLTASPTDAMGPRGDMLTMTYLKDRGTVHYGQVLTQPQLRAGLNGDAVAATVVFRKQATPQVRTVSATSTHDLSAAKLEINGAGDVLTWRYWFTGDYNQDGSILATDLGPIGLNFLATVPDENSFLSAVDGNQDGKILATDLGPIGLFFLQKCTGYNVYASDQAGFADAYPATNSAASTTTPVGNVPFGDIDTGDGAGRTNDAATNRLEFTFGISPDATLVYWVRVADGASEGSRSNFVGNTTGLTATLALVSGETGGDGTSGNRYQVSDTTDIVFMVMDKDGVTDVTAGGTTVFTVIPPGIGSVVGGVLDVNDGQTGQFQVSCSVDGLGTSPPSLFFDLGGVVVPGGLFIMPDPASPTDWEGVGAAAGTLLDPYILGNSSFNNTFEGDNLTRTGIFATLANTEEDGSGTAIDPTTLTWGLTLTPFGATFLGTPNDGTFKVGNFTNDSIFAQNDELDMSNPIYIQVNGLPSD